MAKKYFYTTLLFICLFSFGAMAQENKSNAVSGKEPIEGLNIYPNPAKADRIYITTPKPTLSKEIEIYDMLGKKIMQLTLNGKEVNISGLNRGVYIIKVKEGEASATRKLVVE